MRITQSNRDRLVIKDFPWAFGSIFCLLGSAAVYFGVRELVFGHAQDKAEGIVGVVGLGFILAGAVFTQRSVFIFDLTQQQVVWSRVSIFGRQGGTVPFGRITGCGVQSITNRNSATTYRLFLAIPEGDVPLTQAYSAGPSLVRLDMRRAIHSALGLPPPEPESFADIDGQIKALVANGQFIAAIKLVRERRGIGLAEAKAVVDAMK